MGLLTDKLADDEKNGRQPKRYIMTVEQFLEKSGSCTCEDCIEGTQKRLSDLPAAPDWATHFAGGQLLGRREDDEFEINEEIPK